MTFFLDTYIGCLQVVCNNQNTIQEIMLDRYFLMMYCDNYLPINLSDLHKEFALEPDAAMLTVYSNLDGYTRNNVFVDSTGYVTKYDPTRSSSDLNGGATLALVL